MQLTFAYKPSQQQFLDQSVSKADSPIEVKDVMTVPTTWLSTDATLMQAAFALSHSAVNELIVLDDRGHFVGLLTGRDLLFAILPDFEGILAEDGSIMAAFHLFLTKGEQMADLPILPLIQREVYTISPTEDITKAATLMAHKPVSSLPVLQDGRCVGLLSAADLCQTVLRNNH